MDTLLDNPDMEIFTDGSSFVRDGKHKAGYTMVTAEQVSETKSLPQGTSAQLAELVALTRAFSSVHFSRSVVSDSATHESQNARPPCPSPTPGVHSDSHPLSQ